MTKTGADNSYYFETYNSQKNKNSFDYEYYYSSASRVRFVSSNLAAVASSLMLGILISMSF